MFLEAANGIAGQDLEGIHSSGGRTCLQDNYESHVLKIWPLWNNGYLFLLSTIT